MREYKVLGDAIFLKNDVLRLEEGNPIYNRLDNSHLTGRIDFEERIITLI